MTGFEVDYHNTMKRLVRAIEEMNSLKKEELILTYGVDYSEKASLLKYKERVSRESTTEQTD